MKVSERGEDGGAEEAEGRRGGEGEEFFRETGEGKEGGEPEVEGNGAEGIWEDVALPIRAATGWVARTGDRDGFGCAEMGLSEAGGAGLLGCLSADLGSATT